MSEHNCLTVILAAGEGTRMNSALPKVMHKLAGEPLLGHVVDAAVASGSDRIALVIGPDMQPVADFAAGKNANAAVFVQQERLGTAHAVLSAEPALREGADIVVVLYADTPLITAATLQRTRAVIEEGADIAVLGFRTDNPQGYGRLLTEANGQLFAIREERDASADERSITLCNSGVMAFRGKHVLKLLNRIGNDNAKKEYYLTDAVEIAVASGLRAQALECGEQEVMGINTRAQLAAAEASIQAELRQSAMAGGVTLIAPETVYLSRDTRFGRDIVIEPHVVIGPGVSIASNATIKAFCHIEGASIGEGARVGPYARLRPGASLAATSRVGNFVEIKNADIGEGAKVNHLTYIGDARVGAQANVGAGTITCNYDGYEKHRTIIGDGAFIGSNSALVAPVIVGDGAYVGSGSVITENVEDDALALERAPQVAKPGWARRFRERHRRKSKT